MSKRYFINNIDTFIGQQLLAELYKPSEEGEQVDSSEFKIMATYTTPHRLDKQPGVKKILKRYKPKLSRKKMLEENDVWIYDLSSLADLKFAIDILTQLSTLEEPKVLVLISDIRTWGSTPKKVKVQEVKEVFLEEQVIVQEEKPMEDQEEEQYDDSKEDESKLEELKEVIQEQQKIIYEMLRETDYLKRVPLENFNHYKEMEDMVLSLQKENLKIVVVCPGILYGAGENIFKNHFKSAWKQDPVQLPYLDLGDNLIPTIYVKDLIKFIIKVSESPPENDRYLLAVDNSKVKTQKAIVQAISNEVGSGQICSVQSDPMFTEKMSQIFRLDLDIRPSSLLVGEDEAPVDFEWTCEKGLTQNVKLVLNEFKKSEKLRPIKILAYYPTNQEEQLNLNSILQNLSNSYKIPIITLESIFQSVLQQNVNILIQSELSNELRADYESVVELSKKGSKWLDGTSKILFRCMKWRLMQNDCSNRGYILVNCPSNDFESEITFFNQKNKLKTKKVKTKEVKLNEDGVEEEEAVQEEVEEADQEGEEEGAKIEDFYPESIVILKQLKQVFSLTSFKFFKQRNIDILIYDPIGKNPFEIQESLRLYTERNGRPYNYIQNEKQLKQEFDNFYIGVHQELQSAKMEAINKQTLENQQKQQNIQNLLDFVQKQVQLEVENPSLTQKMGLRQFLMENIVPTLSEGLLEVSKVKPEDPIEFLSEYLFEKSFDLQ